MARLPVPGGDSGAWGTILNEFLSESHNSDGTLKSAAVQSTLPDATSIAKGIVQLTGDLGGTAASPTVPGLATHIAGTTSVHGIADTSALETTTGAQSKVDTHVNDTTAAHAASAISFTPAAGVAATDTQGAVAEVAGDVTTHAADTTQHAGGTAAAQCVVESDFSTTSATSVNVTGMQTAAFEWDGRPIRIEFSATFILSAAATGTVEIWGRINGGTWGQTVGAFSLAEYPLISTGSQSRRITFFTIIPHSGFNPTIGDDLEFKVMMKVTGGVTFTLDAGGFGVIWPGILQVIRQ
jgi:hypothetical protein